MKEAPKHNATTTQQHKPFFNTSGPEHFFGGSQRSNDAFFNHTGAQPRLEVGKKDDAFERQADRTADKVVSQINQPAAKPAVQAKEASGKEDDKLQKKEEDMERSGEQVQRKPVFESDEPPIQRKAAGGLMMKSNGDPATASPSVEAGLQASKGGGAPMENGTRAKMESAFGADFSQVRIHQDNNAKGMSKDLNAQAFTHGNDIYFNEGKYDPNSASGSHLLAHELTHTLQQSGIRKKSIQRKEDPKPSVRKATQKDLEDQELKTGKYKGVLTKNGGSVEVHLKKFETKRYLAKEDTDWIDKPVKLPKAGAERKTRQISIWRSAVKADVLTRLKELDKSSSGDDKDISLNLKSQKKSGIIGRMNQLANEVSVPFWSASGSPATYDVEHMVDWQIAGPKADDIKNLILLDRRYNRSLGNKVRESIHKHLEVLVAHYQKSFSALGKSAEGTLASFNVFIDDFKFDTEIIPNDHWYFKEELTDKSENGHPYKKEHIDVVDPKIPDGRFLLKTGGSRAGYLLPHNKTERVGAWFITSEFDKTNGKLINLSFQPAVKEGRSIIGKGDEISTKTKVKKVTVDYDEVGNRVYQLNASDLRKKFGPVFKEMYGEVKGLSPIELSEPNMEDMDVSITGKVKSTLSIFKNVDIDFMMENGEFSITATIDGTSLAQNFPKPFEITAANLIIAASTGSGLSVAGAILFKLGNFGEGEVEASVSKNSVGFGGRFNFNNKWFNPAEVKIGYKDGKWSMGGKIGIPPGMIPGVDSAQLEVSYDAGTFAAAGEAKLKIPGVDKVMLAASFDGSGNFTFVAEAALSELPGIKSGNVKITIGNKEGGGMKLRAEGQATPDFPAVPGLSANLAVVYDDGLFDVRTKVGYKKGRFDGNVEVGVTNMAVDAKGQPVGGPDPSGGVSVFGFGQLTVTIFGDNKATIGVRLTPDKQLLIAGELLLQNLSPFGDGYAFEKPLLTFPRITIPLIGIPGVSVSAFVDGGVFFKFNWQPLILKQLKVAFNEININDISSATLDISGSIGSMADAEVYMTINAGLEARVLIATLSGSLGGEAGLGINAEAGGDVKAEWDMEKGLKFKEVNAHLNVTPRAIFRLTGSVSIDLDLWLTTVNLYYHKWILAEKAIDMGGLAFNIDFPIRFNDDNSIVPPTYETMNVKKPDFSGDQGRNILDKAINGDAEKELAAKKEEIRSTIRYDLRNSTNDEDFTPSKYTNEMVKKYGKSEELKQFVLDTIRDESRALEYELFNSYKSKLRFSRISLQAKHNLIDFAATWLFQYVEQSDINAFKAELVRLDEEEKKKAAPAPSPTTV